jgi:hypothetical protein
VDVEGFLREHPAFRETFIPAAGTAAYATDGDSAHRRLYHPFLRPPRSSTAGSGGLLEPRVDRKPLSADELLTCPPLVPAFSFSARSWGLVLVEKLEDVVWNPDVYDNLKLEDDTKSKLRTIVRGHSAHLTDFDDFIAGKGRGLVFLLHGPPGCGKTMTAGEYAVGYPGSA